MRRHLASIGVAALVAAALAAGVLFLAPEHHPPAPPTATVVALPVAAGQSDGLMPTTAAQDEPAVALPSYNVVPNLRTGGPTPEELMAAAREAVGVDAFTRSGKPVRLQGITEGGEHSGDFSLLFKPNGQFVQQVDGDLRVETGFDGKRGWSVVSEARGVGVAADDVAIPAMVTWVVSGHWLSSQADLSVEPAGGSRPGLRLVSRQQPGCRAVVQLDPETSLPVEIQRTTGSGETERWRLEDYRSVNGLRLAHRLVRRTPGGSISYRVVGAQTVSQKHAGAEVFRMPAGRLANLPRVLAMG